MLLVFRLQFYQVYKTALTKITAWQFWATCLPIQNTLVIRWELKQRNCLLHTTISTQLEQIWTGTTGTYSSTQVNRPALIN